VFNRTETTRTAAGEQTDAQGRTNRQNNMHSDKLRYIADNTARHDVTSSRRVTS